MFEVEAYVFMEMGKRKPKEILERWPAQKITLKEKYEWALISTSFKYSAQTIKIQKRALSLMKGG